MTFNSGLPNSLFRVARIFLSSGRAAHPDYVKTRGNKTFRFLFLTLGKRHVKEKRLGPIRPVKNAIGRHGRRRSPAADGGEPRALCSQVEYWGLTLSSVGA